MTSNPLTIDRHLPVSVTDGLVGGVIAGLVYAAYALSVNVALTGSGELITPLRQIAAVGVGPQALEPAYDATTAIVLGNVIHLGLSALYGVIFAILARLVGLRRTLPLVIAGIAFGAAIYAANLNFVFPTWFPWFLGNDRVVQTVGHTIFFGAIIGWWCGRGSASAA